MRTAHQRAPIFSATWDFSVWLVSKARAAPQDPLARSLAERALRLLDAITFALKDIDRDEALQQADLLLIQLRLRLRLAMETELLSAQQAHFALQQADHIGRQLGGWRKAQERAE
ncbi:hypothetical protein [Accumulibacter sp.]|uniref:hypothetical protein n=1 Tax=Accumulibacter sp. TaxID=2053492 RepID=UPI001ACA470D|nr:hypothetical protein [Accumulibacter sp.]MBN8454034.1 hypothetical protein [Accumulibacter sp.]MBO3708765.1 hypothetical protein [Candidatus Accumulibacter conexus]